MALKGTQGEGLWRGSRAGGQRPRSRAAREQGGGRGDRRNVAGPWGLVAGVARASSQSSRCGAGTRPARRRGGRVWLEPTAGPTLVGVLKDIHVLGISDRVLDLIFSLFA